MIIPALWQLAGLALAESPASPAAGNAGNPALAQTAAAIVAARGQDFATYEATITRRGPDGSPVNSISRFTLLENGLHYLDQGEWKQSQDLLQPDPSGLRATHGPIRALLRPDLVQDATFELTATDGTALSGIVRQILATDAKSSESVLLG